VATAHALQLEAARALFYFNCDAMPSLKSLNTYPLAYYSGFPADTLGLLYAVTLTFDLWTWTFTALRVSCVQTLYKIWAKSNNPRLSYWRFSMFLPYNFRGWGTTDIGLSGTRRPDFTKLTEAWGNQSYTRNLFHSRDILLRFQTRVAQS